MPVGELTVAPLQGESEAQADRAADAVGRGALVDSPSTAPIGTLMRHPAARVIERVGTKALKWLAKRGKNVSGHIAKRHIARRLGKSTFLKGGKQTKSLIERTIKSADNVIDQGRRLRLEKVFGREVGAGGEKVVVVIIEKATGKIVTAFPTRALIVLTATATASTSNASSSADEQIEARRKAVAQAREPSFLESVIDFVTGTSELGVPEDEMAEWRIIDQQVAEAIADIEEEMMRSLSPEEREEVREVIITGMELEPQPG